MIHRQNWLDTRDYLRYTADVRQNAPATVDRVRKHLRHLLEWADATPLPRGAALTPSLPAYLVERKLSPSSIRKGLEAVRQFYLYAIDRWPVRYRPVAPGWVKLLQPPRSARMDSRLPVRQYYSLDAVRQIASVSAETLRQERACAAACFLFLSGMRSDAFASLPVSCLDLERREVRQLPELGVRTKNRKAALTYLLDLPDLLAVVERWDRRLRPLPAETLWYSPVTCDGMSLAPVSRPGSGRTSAVEDDLRLACELAGLPYLSPHKLRHGHVVHALKQARNMAEMKAISQNVMHASVVITDQVYGRLLDDDVRTIITGLGKQTQPDDRLDEILRLLKQDRSL